ncbi:MAG: hypothetical protein ABII27_08835 [bacterium]
MSQKIAIAIIHGVGIQKKDFADGIIKKLTISFSKHIRKYSRYPDKELVIKPVFWSPVLQNLEIELWERLKTGGRMSYKKVRKFIVDFAADAIAYQPSPHDRETYDNIHSVFAKTLKQLSKEAGAKAPLCIISHSLGTIIASNYIYDLEVCKKKKIISAKVCKYMA